MAKPSSINELINLIPANLVHTAKYVQNNEVQNDFLSFDDDTVPLPLAQYKNHCFSDSFLYYSSAYGEQMNRRLVLFLNDCILLDMSRIKKSLRISVIADLKYETDIKLLEFLQQFGYIRSPFELELSKPLKHGEVVHTIADVFNPESYQNSKKRSQRLAQPLKVLVDNKITRVQLTKDDLPQIENFCNIWYETKLLDPGVFQMLFSNPFNHIRLGITDPSYGEVHGYKDASGELLNVQLLGIDGINAYSLYNVTTRTYHDSRINSACYLDIMKYLESKGVQKWNVGLELNKNLASFKHHYPSSVLYFYHYGSDKGEE